MLVGIHRDSHGRREEEMGLKTSVTTWILAIVSPLNSKVLWSTRFQRARCHLGGLYWLVFEPE